MSWCQCEGCNENKASCPLHDNKNLREAYVLISHAAMFASTPSMREWLEKNKHLGERGVT